MSDKAKYTKTRELIISYLKDKPELDNLELAECMLLNEGLDESVDYLKNIISAIRLELSEIEISDDDESVVPWIIDDDSYVIKSKKGTVVLTIEEADRIFYEYSKHGLGWSQESVRNKHDISIWNWHALKRALWLYKDSNIFSPYTVDITPPDELRDLIASKLEFKEHDKKRMVEEEHDKILKRSYNKAIDELNRKDLGFKYLIDGLEDVLPHVKISPLKRHTFKDGLNPKHLVVPIADIHIGAEVRELRKTPNFDINIANRIMDKAADRINERGADVVHLAFLGDMIESFTGLNHKNSWKGMGYNMYGSKVIKHAIDLLERFLGRVNNVGAVYGIAGNHDRTTSDKGEDDKGEIADVLFYILQRIYGDHLPIEYDPLVITKEIDGINYMITHGDKKVIKKDPRDFLFEYGRNDMFNVVLTGHLHERSIAKDTEKYRWLRCPSIFTGNWYSEQNNWHSHSGILMIENDGHGLPTVTDISISPDK